MPRLADTPTLETERLILRAPGPQDWEHSAAFLATDRARFVGGPADIRTAWQIYGHIVGHWVLRGFGLFVVCDKARDRALGTIGPWFPADWPEREIGWTIWREEDEGAGFAAEAARAVLQHVFRDLGWSTAVSYIDPANARSIALAERLGALRDEAAKGPSAGDLVFRHPAPAGAA